MAKKKQQVVSSTRGAHRRRRQQRRYISLLMSCVGGGSPPLPGHISPMFDGALIGVDVNNDNITHGFPMVEVQQPESPMGSPRTPNGSQKKPVLGKVKSKAKKWMHLLHHKKKPQEDMQDPVQTAAAAMSTTMQTTDPQAQLDIHPHSSCAPEVYMEASPRQNSPLPSPTAHNKQQYFKISSRFKSEMKEAMLRESKQLRVNTTKPKTVTFAPILEQGAETVKNDWHRKELWETATEIFSHAYAIVYEAVLRMVSIIQDAMLSYNIGRRQMLEKIISFNRYLMLKLAPGEGDKVLSKVITEAALDMFYAWCVNVERPLVQRAKEVSSWFLPERREELPPSCSTVHPSLCL
uniref:LTI65/LTI78 PGEED repeat domain-containing protein n=1 Tax=Oryza glumipatula TaxID=40148 RepID=A0A0D9ZBK6_9ORYZ